MQYALPKVTESNRQERLLEAILPLLQKKSSPFDPVFVVVPSLAIKRFFASELARRTGVCFGIHLMTIGEAIPELIRQFGERGKNLRCPGRLHLALLIREKMSEMSGHPFEPLFNDKTAGEKQLELSLKMAKAFLELGEALPEEIASFKEKHFLTWQKQLFEEIFEEGGVPLFSHLVDALRFSTSRRGTIHLFGFSTMTAAKLRFFEKFTDIMPLFYWNLSPSRMFWGDLVSGTSRYKMIDRLKERGVSYELLEDLEFYLEEGNPLLANNGKLGRVWRTYFERLNASSYEDYVISEKVGELEPYRDLLVDGVDTFQADFPTILHRIQADLVLLRSHETPLFVENDESVEVHSFPSRFREVEGLYDRLYRFVKEKGVYPGEILVMAPSIDLYLPEIRAVFSREESVLEAEVVDTPRGQSSKFIRRVLQFLKIAKGRFSLEELEEMISWDEFRKKHQDLRELLHLLKKSGVNFGFNREHRELSFQGPLIEKSERGTFFQGIDQLLLTLSNAKRDDTYFIERELDPSLYFLRYHQTEALDALMELLEELKRDFYPFNDQKTRSLEEWIPIVFSLVEKYLDPLGEEEEWDRFKEILKELLDDSLLKNARYEFQEIKLILSNHPTLSEEVGGDKKLHAIRFSSLGPMRAVPANTIVLLGMSSEDFPRKEVDGAPFFGEGKITPVLQKDHDRYLFLEAILSAREHLIISYTAKEKEGPANPVLDLLHYLDERFKIDARPISAHLHQFHKDLAFDQEYFKKGSSLQGGSRVEYETACKLQGTSRKGHVLPKPKQKEELNLDLLPTHLTLSEISYAISHPLRHYLKKRLGISFKKSLPFHPLLEELEEKDIYPGDYLGYALRYPMEKVLDAIQREGKFPLKPFLEPAKLKFEGKLKQLLKGLKSLGISKNEIFELEFCPSKSHLVEVDEGKFKTPPLLVECFGKKVMITGSLPLVSKKGLLLTSKPSIESTIRMLPQLLAHDEMENYGFSKRAFSIDQGIEIKKPKQDFQLLLELYLRASQEPLPHLPSFVDSLAKGDHARFKKALFMKEESAFSEKDPYLDFMVTSKEEFVESAFTGWQEETRRLYQFLEAEDERI